MGGFLIPNSGYYLTGAKDGNLYLLNKDDMGGYLPSSDQVRQVVPLGGRANVHCQAAYYKGSSPEFIYGWPENDPLRAIPFDRASNLLAPQRQVVPPAGPTVPSGAALPWSSTDS